MVRFALSALVVFVLSSTASAQQPTQTADLSSLGKGTIYGLKVVELDGQPGAEYLLATSFSDTWLVAYPQAPGGLCFAGSIHLDPMAIIADTNADGIQEIVRFDFQAQKVTWTPLPTCPTNDTGGR